MLDLISALGALAFYLFTYFAAIYLGLRSGSPLSIHAALGAAFRVAKVALLIWLATLLLWSLVRASVPFSPAEELFVWSFLLVLTLAVALRTKVGPLLHVLWLVPWLLLLSLGWWVIWFYCSTPHSLLWYLLNGFVG